MARAQEIFDGSGDAVFGIDRRRRIAYVNEAFAQILQREAPGMLGRSCHEVLCADDLSSRRFCTSRCPVAREALQNGPVQPFDLILTRDGGERCWVNIGVYATATADVGEPQAYFALRAVNGHRLLHQMASDLHRPATPASLSRLSRREREVLQLTVRGRDTVAISRDLSISPQTVRNHFKNIFSKLEVHTRSQAVALALRQQLI